MKGNYRGFARIANPGVADRYNGFSAFGFAAEQFALLL
jgi:hypothetical protein